MENNSIVYGGRIATHDKPVFYGQIAIDKNSGLITDVTEGKLKYTTDRVFGDSCIIFPGFGDTHIHAREDETKIQVYKEDYITAANAALNGGVVHVSAMPNTPNPVTINERFKWHRNRIHQINHPVAILNYVGIGEGTRPIGNPREDPYKVFFGKSVGSLTIYDEHELRRTIQHYIEHNISWHIEYEPFIEASVDGKTHSERRPIGAVNHGLRLALPIIEKYRVSAKLCHWSTGGQSFDMIADHREKARKSGLPYTTVEVSPLHLLFDTSMTDQNPDLWLKIQMNPAIQGEMHRLDLIEGLRTEFIDYLATDHAPHTLEEKYAAFAKFKDDFPSLTNVQIAEKIKKMDEKLFFKTCCENNTSGAPWLDTYANVCVWLMAEHGFTPQDIARVASHNPGEFVNQFLGKQFPETDFGKGFGEIEKGYVGSLTVLNTDKPQVIEASNLQTRVGWSPLEGMEFSGGLEAVIIKGEEVTGNFV